MTGVDQGGEKPPAAPDGTVELSPKKERRGRVLIVEDNWLIAVELESVLEEAGYAVVGLAMSADEAVEMGAAQRPDLVLMDIRLRGDRDGIDAATELRDRYDVPSVFTTAHGEPETRARGQAARPLGWIIKPITGADLVLRLDEIQRAGP